MSESKPPDPLGKFAQDWMRRMAVEFENNPVIKDIQARWNEARTDFGNYVPAVDVDIVQSIEGVTVKVDMAGFDKKDIQLDIDKNVLLIAAERQKAAEAGKVHLSGRPSMVRKKVLLPFMFGETDQPVANADYTDGVLTVHIKKPKSKKSIPVT